jgi:CheY-like chemotaxis protein
MKKILFVEDDAVVARIYSQKLAAAGFEVLVAEDGLVAVKTLPEFKPDLVVLDLMMPKFSGLDVLRFMRKHPQLKSTRVIVLSNAFLNRLGEEVAGLGVEEMLGKAAMTPALLIETIKRTLESSPAASPLPSEPPAAPAPAPSAPAVPASAPPQPAAAPARSGNTETVLRNESAAAFRDRMRKDFFEQIPSINKTLRQAAAEFHEAPDPQTRLAKLEVLARKVKFINNMTAMAGCHRVGLLSSALEALLFELQEKPTTVQESSRHTIISTVTLLESWLSRADQPDDESFSPPSILIVDDDVVSNRALVFALGRVNLIAKSVEDAQKALEKLRENAFDAVLLDINLPGMNGFVLCECLRALPLHKDTPVIFITSYAEFESRARSLPGISDFITKPILPIELTVKVTAHVLKRRMNGEADA